MNSIKTFSLLILIATSNLSCFIPPADSRYSYNQLIEKTETILLVQLTDEKRRNKNFVGFLKTNKGNFHVLEEVKGQSPKKTSLYGFYKEYSKNDFNEHNDTVFWNQNTGRTLLRNGECGPSHNYQLNKQYLIFIESQNNIKAAELIKSKEDKWYKYVKKYVK